MKKILSILTAALLMGSLFSCSKEPLTPEGMFKTITEAEERRMEMVIVYGEIQTSTTIIEEEGDQSLVRMETESFGASDGAKNKKPSKKRAFKLEDDCFPMLC